MTLNTLWWYYSCGMILHSRPFLKIKPTRLLVTDIETQCRSHQLQQEHERQQSNNSQIKKGCDCTNNNLSPLYQQNNCLMPLYRLLFTCRAVRMLSCLVVPKNRAIHAIHGNMDDNGQTQTHFDCKTSWALDTHRIALPYPCIDISCLVVQFGCIRLLSFQKIEWFAPSMATCTRTVKLKHVLTARQVELLILIE